MVRNSFTGLILALITSFLVYFILGFFTDNIYLIYLIADILMAFIYALFTLPYDKIHFYRYYEFHYMFASNMVFLLIATIILCLFI